MRVIEPSLRVEGFYFSNGTPRYEVPYEEGVRICKELEKAARTCYKSEDRITDDSYRKMLRDIVDSEHESVIEHEKITVRIVCDRGVSHEAVRHRLASFSQESTRYCNYAKDKFGNEVTFIRPLFRDPGSEPYWRAAMEEAEKAYFVLINRGCNPGEARSVLPHSVKTELVMTANIREWRHILRLRTSPRAHPQMRQIMVPFLRHLRERIPLLFEDIEVVSE